MAKTRRDFLGAVSSAAAVGVIHTQTALASSSSPKRPLGIALVGLGSQTSSDLFDGLASSQRCKITSLVSGDFSKASTLANRYGISKRHLYNYDNFDQIANDPSIDIVYIAVPNAMHCEFAVRAAQAGKHVFCESPMAIGVDQCQSMIDACCQNARHLGVASSPLCRPLGCLGTIRSIQASNAFAIDRPKSWRLRRYLCGSGAMLQAGIDVLRTQRLWAESNPLWVIAQETKTDPMRYGQLEESVTWTLGFQNGTIAHGAASINYQGPCQLSVQGSIGSFNSEFPTSNHYWTRADQLENFASTILAAPLLPENRFNSLSPEQALEDMRLVEAISRSIQEQRQVQLS